MDRLIQVKDIPPSLWSVSEQNLSLPGSLIDSWIELLEANNLINLAKQPTPGRRVGGRSEKDTGEHLAWRYTGSCGRVLMTLLDPKGELNEVADSYAQIFAANKVLLVDLPCGSGAAVVSIITTLIELRKQSVIPRLPVTIKVVAADLSKHAINYCSRQIEYLATTAEEQAIFIEFEPLEWNVLDKISTADLIHKLTIASQDCQSRLLVLSNFSDFLDNNDMWELAAPQFEQIFIHSRDKSSTAIWIEPGTSNTPAFFLKIISWFTKLFSKIKKLMLATDTSYAISRSKCKHPLRGHLFHVNLVVKRFQLPTKD